MKVPKIEDRGLLSGSGNVVPSDESNGWQTGAFFQKTNGVNGSVLYVNLGTVESAMFRQVLLYEPE